MSGKAATSQTYRSAALYEFSRGWPIIVGALIGVTISVSSLPLYVSGVFVAALEAEYGWTRTQLSVGMLVWTGTLAVVFPVAGYVIDRFGLRGPLGFSLIGASAIYAVIGYAVENLATYYALYALLALVGAIATPIGYTRAITSWFSRARGFAFGLVLIGTGLCAAFAPRLLTSCIETYGSWRAGYFAIAITMLAATPLILALVRVRPKTPTPDNGDVKKVGETGSDTTFSQAVRTRAYWLLFFAFLLQSLAISGVIVHFVPMLIDSGATLSEAAEIAGYIGFAVILGRLSIGFAVDTISPPFVAAIVCVVAAIGVCALAAFGAIFQIVAAVAIGFAMGAEVDLIGFMTARYFGTTHYGKIYGTLYGIFTLAVGASPIWIGALYDTQQSYVYALWLVGALLIVSGALFYSLRYTPVSTLID